MYFIQTWYEPGRVINVSVQETQNNLSQTTTTTTTNISLNLRFPTLTST